MIKEILKEIKEEGEVAVGVNGGQGDLGTLPNNPLQAITGSGEWSFKALIKSLSGENELNKEKEEDEEE